LEPNKSLASGPIVGAKKPKDRVTIMLACNATGFHSYQLFFFISSKIQNAFVISTKKHFQWPVRYYRNNSSWMVNQQTRNQRRNILLLVDNVLPHHLEEDNVLSNIRYTVFLSPNTTAHLQPIDQGIIHSFKVNYSFLKSFFFFFKMLILYIVLTVTL